MRTYTYLAKLNLNKNRYNNIMSGCLHLIMLMGAISHNNLLIEESVLLAKENIQYLYS